MSKQAKTKKTGTEDDGFTAAQEALLDAAASNDSDDTGIEGGADAAETLKKETEEELPSVEELQKQLKEANAERDRERKRAEAAEAEKNKSALDQVSVVRDRFKSAEDKLETDKNLAKKELEEAKRVYREAYESGDTDKVLEANDKLFDAKTRIKVLEDNEIGLKNAKNKFEQTVEEASKKQTQTDDDEDGEYLTDEGLTAYSKEAQQWIKKSAPQFRESKEFRSKAIKYHHLAIGNDIEVDSPEYFEFLEKKLGLREEDTQVDDATDVDTQTSQRTTQKTAVKKPVTAAPVNRQSTNTTATKGGRFVKLTPEELEAAEISNMTPDEYRLAKYGQ